MLVAAEGGGAVFLRRGFDAALVSRRGGRTGDRGSRGEAGVHDIKT